MINELITSNKREKKESFGSIGELLSPVGVYSSLIESMTVCKSGDRLCRNRTGFFCYFQVPIIISWDSFVSVFAWPMRCRDQIKHASLIKQYLGLYVE